MTARKIFQTPWLWLLFALSLVILVSFFLPTLALPEDQHPIHEFLFGFEEEGYVYYPVSHRNYFFVITGLVLLLLLVVAAMLVQNSRAAKVLEKKNKVITGFNQKITSSIQYAQKIQHSLLPSEQLVKSYFSDAFVLYQPRDIVSGDFFWVSEVGNLKLVAAIDCTGHGVPGAFLTIMANQALRKIVYERAITSPAEILFEMHKDILTAFNQNKASLGGDGMDIGICLIDYDDRVLHFAGANMPLLHTSGTGITRIKGDRLWVGSPLINAEGPNPFQQKVIPFYSTDSFYLFSDGYSDQFGGERDRKFLFSNLQKLLNEVSRLTMDEQKDKLEDALSRWKGTTAQTDDILGVGFKV